MAVTRQFLGDHAAHVVGIEIEHERGARGHAAVHDVIGRHDLNRHLRFAAVGAFRQIGRPARPGGQHDPGGAELDDIVGGKTALAVDLDMAHGLESTEPPGADTAPGGKTRQAAFPADPSTKVPARLGERHAITALAKGAGAFQAGRSRTHHEDTAVAPLGRNSLGMPSAAPLLAHGRVLSAADRYALGIGRHADIAADALADLVDPAFLELPGQKRIGDGRPRRADEVEDAVADLAHHGVG